MLELNDGLRPHYDAEFDEAVRRNFEGLPLNPEHKDAIRRICEPQIFQEILAINTEHMISKD